MIRPAITILLCFLTTVSFQSTYGQVSDSLIKIPAKYLDKVSAKSSAIEEQLDKKSQKALEKLQKQEAKMKQKFSKIDSLAAKEIFAKSDEKYKDLQEKFSKFGFVKELKQVNKQVYYYAAQIKEYKEILNDPKKIEQKAIELLSKTKMFKDFMAKNSMLASLFRLPGDPTDPNYVASLAGLQTRASVNNLIQQQISAGGPNAQQQFQSNLQQAQSQVRQLKDKVMQMSGGSSDDILPEGFKPNDQKTKNFWKRMEVGTNFQTQRATNFFPVTSDIGLSLGYKLNDKSIIGIGASYKFGWGSGWDHMKISSQGAGLRSFIDWKIKGSFWISGGYEQNYKEAFKSIDQLQNYSAWQTSGLIGISKVVSVKSKIFKKTKVQLLWDFLSYQQVPRTQAILFRLNYNFK